MRTQLTAAALVAVMILSVVAVGTAGFGVVGAASEEVQTVPHTGGSELQPESTSGTVGPGLEDASDETSALVFLEPADVGPEMTPDEVQKKLQAQAEDTQPAVTSQLDDMGVDVRNGFWIVNALVVTYDADELTAEQIASVEGVRLVTENSEIHPPDPSIDQQEVTPQGDSTYGLEQINATTVWDEFGTQGDGGVVVIQDNGFDLNHTALDFEEAWMIDSSGEKDGPPSNDTQQPHGTHVAGTTAGGEDPSGTAFGVAPGAELHGHDIFSAQPAVVSASIGSMEIAVEEDADVVSGSWGSGCVDGSSPGYIDQLIEPINNTELAGTAVLTSAGNGGEGCVSGFGNDHEAPGIGASAENESIANFSSGGLIDKDDGQPDWPDADAWDNPSEDWPQSWVEPRVSAPGVDVISSIPGNSYASTSGTSMAAPHVAGAIALAQAATAENFTGPEIREALVETAWKPDDWDEEDARWTDDNVTMDQPGIDSRYGHGIIDVGATIELLESEAFFDVSIDETTSPVTEGEMLTVNATIENTGTAEDTQVIELDAEELGNDSVVATVDPNESTQIPFFVETSEGDAGDYTTTLSSQDDSDSTTVTVVEPAFFDVTIDETNSPVTEGETLEINTTIENTGGDEGVQQIELDAGNLGNHSAFVTLDSNESTEETFTLETTEGDAGDYTATLSSQDDSDSTTVEVVEPAFFDVSIDETNSPVSEGETLEINTTIVNTGGEEDTQTIELDAGELGTDSELVTLDGNDSTQQAFSLETVEGDAGDYIATLSSQDSNDSTAVEVVGTEFFDVSIDETTSPVTEGEMLTVNATIENTGTAEDTQVIELDAEELGNDSVVATVDPNDSTQKVFSLETTEGDAGDYTATLSSQDDSDSTTVTVVGPAFFGVTIEETTSPVEVNETLDVNTTIVNTGTETATQTIEMVIDNQTRDSTSVTLDGNSSTSRTLQWTPEDSDAGTHTATVSSDDDFDTVEIDVLDDEPSVSDYADEEDNIVRTQGLLDAISDWRGGGIDTSLLLDVIGAWRDGDPVA